MALAFQTNDDLAYVGHEKAYQREYYLKNREKIREQVRKYQQEHREEINARRRKKPEEKKHKDRGFIFESSSQYMKLHYAEVGAVKNLEKKVLSLQIVSGLKKPVCSCCGCEDIRVLTINHLNGDGAKERKTIKLVSLREEIISGNRNTSDLNVLCMNCNILYEYERGKKKMPRDWPQIIDELTRG